ncbi:MAG: pilin [Minisyncoccia bacterium]
MDPVRVTITETPLWANAVGSSRMRYNVSMSRYRAFLFLAIVASISFFPNVASAQSFFGPIISEECAACEYGAGWGCVLETVGNVINLGLTLAISFAVLLIAYAGFLWVTNPANPENLSKGKTILKNAVIGLVIALGAWVIVNTILLALTGKNVTQQTSVLSDSNRCLPEPDPYVPPEGGTGGVSGSGGGSQQGQPAIGDCSPTALESAGWPSSLSRRMSCVTTYENGPCDYAAPSGTDLADNGRGPSVSIGLFQVNLSAHDMNYPACQALNNGQPLNCTQAFSGGTYTSRNHATHVENGSLYEKCVAVASNPSCNTAAAIDIYNRQGIAAWGLPAQANCSSL